MPKLLKNLSGYFDSIKLENDEIIVYRKFVNPEDHGFNNGVDVEIPFANKKYSNISVIITSKRIIFNNCAIFGGFTKYLYIKNIINITTLKKFFKEIISIQYLDGIYKIYSSIFESNEILKAISKSRFNSMEISENILYSNELDFKIPPENKKFRKYNGALVIITSKRIVFKYFGVFKRFTKYLYIKNIINITTLKKFFKEIISIQCPDGIYKIYGSIFKSSEILQTINKSREKYLQTKKQCANK